MLVLSLFAIYLANPLTDLANKIALASPVKGKQQRSGNSHTGNVATRSSAISALGAPESNQQL